MVATPATGSAEPEGCYTACQALSAMYTIVGVDESGDCICYTEDTSPSTAELVDDDGMNGLCNNGCTGDISKSCGSTIDPTNVMYSVYSVTQVTTVGPESPTLEGCYL